MDSDKYIPIVKANYKSKEDINNIVKLLKEAGASYIDSVSAIARIANLPLREVDDIQLNSPSYIDEKDKITELRNLTNNIWFSDEPYEEGDTPQ